ncbi:MAG: hypothetical protein U0667_06330 [Chloroflexota bacterium]
MLKGLIQSEGRFGSTHCSCPQHDDRRAGAHGSGVQLLVYFSDILLILVMAWLFAFILSPLASWIERRLPVLPRVVVVGVIYTLLPCLAALVVALSVTVADNPRPHQ